MHNSVFRLDLLSGVVLILVLLLSIFIGRFSVRYLAYQPGRRRYAGWFVATIAAVTTLVLSANMVMLAVAWTITSLCLHQMLMFFPARAEAQTVAHKKFLMARLGDFLVFAAVVTIGLALGTFNIELAMQRATSTAYLPLVMHAGAVLLAAGVIVRSAQLPFHGWLIQVMEAPTPVSALLHAGVVNMGGYVLIRFAPLMMLTPSAQALLVIAGATTAALAGLIMMTRVSVKVSLAWSTCAQLGFMLVECGLGAYTLALIHLVSHSLYKAHAFLSSGSVVQDAVDRQWSLDQEAPSLFRNFRDVGLAIGVFIAWHYMVSDIGPLPHQSPSVFLIVCAAVPFVFLATLQCLVMASPTGAIAREWYPHFLAGLYLDELFTRMTFSIWPPQSITTTGHHTAAQLATPSRRFA